MYSPAFEIIFSVILFLCAASDAASYRIPDRLNSFLFIGVLLASLFGFHNVSINSTLFSFLIFYPPLFVLWWGGSISGTPDMPAVTPSSTYLETFKDVIAVVILPSPVSWLILMIVSVVLMGSVFLIPVAVAFLCLTIILVFRNKKCWMGGGDKKMLASCMAMVGIEGASGFALTLSLCNFFLILWLYVYRAYRKKNGKTYETEWHSRRVPMGVSIAVAGIIMLLTGKPGVAL